MQKVPFLFIFTALLAVGVECVVSKQRHVVAQAIVLPESQRRAAQLMPTDGSFSSNLDINVDFRYFVNDPSRNCLAPGELVPLNFGGPADATNCTDMYPAGNWTQSTLEPNCTIVCDADDVVSLTRQQYFNELFGQVRTQPFPVIHHAIRHFVILSATSSPSRH
jgi:hypothetical protein